MSIYLFNLLTERVLYTLASNHKVSHRAKKKKHGFEKKKKKILPNSTFLQFKC